MKPVLNDFVLRIIPPREQWDDDEASYDAHIAAIQRLRGAVYLEDGAIPPEALDAEGLHRSEWDERSYHLCAWSKEETLAACLRLTVHPELVTSEGLCLNTALARVPYPIKDRVLTALDNRMQQARHESLSFGEIGGWAVDIKYRRNRALLVLPVVTYSLHEHIGSGVGMIHATYRHRSVEILKELGVKALTDDQGPLPPYFDSYYNCDMEFICFDSRKPAERFKPVIDTFLAAIKQGHRVIDKMVIEKHLAD